MPSGVAEGFLDILRHDDRAHKRRIFVLSLVCLGLAGPAWWLAGNTGLVAHAAGALAGAGIGVIVAASRATSYSRRLRSHWRQYQQLSAGSRSFLELHRKVLGRPGQDSVYIAAAGLTIAWAAELGAIVLALGQNLGDLSALVVVGINGLVAGALLAHNGRMLAWLRGFGRSVQEMLAAGEIGRWGSI